MKPNPKIIQQYFNPVSWRYRLWHFIEQDKSSRGPDKHSVDDLVGEGKVRKFIDLELKRVVELHVKVI